MKNYQKTAFLKKGYALLSKNEQEYMKTILNSLLHIQNTVPSAPVDIPDKNKNGAESQGEEQ